MNHSPQNVILNPSLRSRAGFVKNLLGTAKTRSFAVLKMPHRAWLRTTDD